MHRFVPSSPPFPGGFFFFFLCVCCGQQNMKADRPRERVKQRFLPASPMQESPQSSAKNSSGWLALTTQATVSLDELRPTHLRDARERRQTAAGTEPPSEHPYPHCMQMDVRLPVPKMNLFNTRGLTIDRMCSFVSSSETVDYYYYYYYGDRNGPPSPTPTPTCVCPVG